MKTQQNIRATFTAMALTISTTLLLQSLNEGRQAIAADLQAQLAQKQSPAPVKEEYVTRLFDLSGKKLAQFEGRKSRFSSDGQRLLTESSYGLGRFYLYNISGKKLLEFEGRTAEFSPGGQRLLVLMSGKDYFQLYDAMGRRLAQLPGTVSQSPIFSQDGQRLVTLAENSAYLFDASGRQIAQMRGQFDDLGGGFNSSGQRLILSQKGTYTCTLFNSSGEVIARLPKVCAGVSPKGQRFLITNGNLYDPSLRLYDFSGREVAQLPYSFAIFSCDEQFILATNVIGGEDSSYLYNSVGKKIAHLQGTAGRFSSTGKRLVTVSGNIVHLYDVSGKELARLPGNRAAFSPKGEKFVTFLFGKNKQPNDVSGGESRLFNQSGRELALLTGDFSRSFEVMFGAGVFSPFFNKDVCGTSSSVFSPDGQELIISDFKNSYLYDSSGKKAAQFPGSFANFSSTGKHIISIVSEGKEGQAGTIYLSDRSGAKLMDAQGESGRFSPDGQHIIIEAKRTIP